ncbi:hypothetical protein DL771_009680 [Monosporascus sp. 5C6A]|nr:hypothetical protein DL771_009680 [Monosporascus sp. 5C6A]
MRAPFEKLENNAYIPRGTPGHGFDGCLDVTIWDGTQYTASKQAVDILQAMTDSLATKVFFSITEATPRAIGLEFLEGKRVYKGDLGCLCTIAADELTPLGIPVMVCLPGVGKNMQDHNETAIPQSEGPNTHAGLNTNSSTPKSNHAVGGELDLHAFSGHFTFLGFWPATTKQTWIDPPNTWDIMTIKDLPAE